VAMIPHERSLVKRYEGKPFAILGVNSDTDPAVLQRRLQESKISWRSFKAVQGAQENIAEDWFITSWPTLFLVDHRGVIRKKWEFSPDWKELDTQIDMLVAEAAKASSK